MTTPTDNEIIDMLREALSEIRDESYDDWAVSKSTTALNNYDEMVEKQKQKE